MNNDVEEFKIIEQYFTSPVQQHDVVMGIGDDSAILNVPEKHQLYVSTDTLVENTHFLSDMPPQALAYKLLAVNVSDLVAMGVKPRFVTLSLTLARVDHDWLSAFSNSLRRYLNEYDIQLVGGDTVSGGLLQVSLTIFGFAPISSRKILRSGAKINDSIFITGTIGDSAVGVDILLKKISPLPLEIQQYFIHRHYYPTVNLSMVNLLQQYANSAIDLSDGLHSELKHICRSSTVGCRVHLENIPLSTQLQSAFDKACQLDYALVGGEDYQLLMTTHKDNHDKVLFACQQLSVPCHYVGDIVDTTEISYFYQGKPYQCTASTFVHFDNTSLKKMSSH